MKKTITLTFDVEEQENNQVKVTLKLDAPEQDALLKVVRSSYLINTLWGDEDNEIDTLHESYSLIEMVASLALIEGQNFNDELTDETAVTT